MESHTITPLASTLSKCPKMKNLIEKLAHFVETECIPAEKIYEEELGSDRFGAIPPIMEKLKVKARALGLWNLFLPKSFVGGPGLSNLEYAVLAEITGRSHLAPEACNCSAPDTGNMETIIKYGSEEQKREWLVPLLEGKIRSAFLMTEPEVASSDATNVQTSMKRVGDHYIINGRKWWSSGAMDPRCKIAIVMGKTDFTAPIHKQQSMILVPMDTPGVKIIRPLHVFGYDDAPHGHAEVLLTNVRVPVSNILLGEGRGFEISQGRLGPGRIHHCMRAIGMAERCFEAMLDRSMKRKTFGKYLAEHGTIQKDIADSRMEIDQARLFVLHTAAMIDTVGAHKARKEIAMIKVAIPNMGCRVADRAIQAHGGGGVSQDFDVARAWVGFRSLRLADGPDEVHRMTTAKMVLHEHSKRAKLIVPSKL